MQILAFNQCQVFSQIKSHFIIHKRIKYLLQRIHFFDFYK